MNGKASMFSGLVGIFICLLTGSLNARPESIPFTPDRWQVYNGKVVEHLGRNSLQGSARLKDCEFRNGIIEFDMAVTGARSYPGIRFRVQSPAAAENIYVRPHIIGIMDNVLQYTPIFNGAACWQLYYGEGYTSGLRIPTGQWVRVRIEVRGQQARVSFGESAAPSLVINQLKHGECSGGIVLTAPPDGSACFSNFRVDKEAEPEFDPPLPVESPPGLLTDWEISRPVKYSQIDLEKTYDRQELPNLQWQKVSCEPSGLVNLSRHVPRQGREPDFVFARTSLESGSGSPLNLGFGYSDWVVVFLNGEELFNGSSPYRGRGSSFQGIIGFFDAVTLPLKKGKNELVLIVGETFGGWGFMCRDAKAVYLKEGVEKRWESRDDFTTAESVLYDPIREVLYVTSFDQFNLGNPRVTQFISKVSLDGGIEERKWIDGLNNPLGMTIHKDRLYTAERNAVAVIDLNEGKVIERYPVAGSVFLNDIAIDKRGNIFITDSRKNVIWKYAEGRAEIWLDGDEVLDPNVIYISGPTLFFGNSGDRTLKSVNLPDKTIQPIAEFETGFIDGFRIDEDGNYLVSLWKGKVYRVTPEGRKTKLLDTTTPGYYSADFEYIQEKRLLIVPNFFHNTITAYQILDN